MKFTKEQRAEAFKEMVKRLDLVSLETLRKMANRIDAKVKRYYEDCEKNNVCPLTGEYVYTSEEGDRLMKKRFNC